MALYDVNRRVQACKCKHATGTSPALYHSTEAGVENMSDTTPYRSHPRGPGLECKGIYPLSTLLLPIHNTTICGGRLFTINSQPNSRSTEHKP